MTAGSRIGGAPACILHADPPDAQRPAFVDATVLPGRGMMLLQSRLRLPSGEISDALAAPDLDAAARLLDGGAEDVAGNRSFSFGGAILAPFANRIRGRAIENARAIDTLVAGRPARLPRNWGGRAPGAEQYAMHGLLLNARARLHRVGASSVEGRLDLGERDGWPGALRFDVVWALEAGGLSLTITATNTGSAATPVGVGWHPYFRVASGERARARLRLAARTRVRVNNYDEVLPTGDLEPVADGPYDFAGPQGRALGETYLDDCFTDLIREDGLPLAELRDEAAGLGLRLFSSSREIRALQVFAPPEKPFVVIEPQFNLADPYGPQWGGRDTGMVLLPAGGEATYRVRVEPFAL